MNCELITAQLDEYLDGTLSPEKSAQFQLHIQECASCQAQQAQIRTFQADLKLLPVAGPDPEFFSQALKQAALSDTSTPRRFGPRFNLGQKVAGAALAASVFVWLAGNIFPGIQLSNTRLAGVTMTLNETRTVQISLNAEHSMQGAKLTIQLPDGVELKGFPGRRVVSWNTDLQQGANILPLPLVAVAVSEGQVIARLEHENKSRELAVQLLVRQPGMSTIVVPSAVS